MQWEPTIWAITARKATEIHGDMTERWDKPGFPRKKLGRVKRSQNTGLPREWRDIRSPHRTLLCRRSGPGSSTAGRTRPKLRVPLNQKTAGLRNMYDTQDSQTLVSTRYYTYRYKTAKTLSLSRMTHTKQAKPALRHVWHIQNGQLRLSVLHDTTANPYSPSSIDIYKTANPYCLSRTDIYKTYNPSCPSCMTHAWQAIPTLRHVLQRQDSRLFSPFVFYSQKPLTQKGPCNTVILNTINK